VPVKIANFERGTDVANARALLAVFAALVVNRNLARLLEMVSSPRYSLASSIFWSAKEDGGFGGKKTSANLAAMSGRGIPDHSGF
jgi:hypothetical protein